MIAQRRLPNISSTPLIGESTRRKVSFRGKEDSLPAFITYERQKNIQRFFRFCRPLLLHVVVDDENMLSHRCLPLFIKKIARPLVKVMLPRTFCVVRRDLASRIPHERGEV